MKTKAFYYLALAFALMACSSEQKTEEVATVVPPAPIVTEKVNLPKNPSPQAIQATLPADKVNQNDLASNESSTVVALERTPTSGNRAVENTAKTVTEAHPSTEEVPIPIGQESTADVEPSNPVEEEVLAFASRDSAPVLAPPSHTVFSSLLKSFVNSKGGVNYQGLQAKKGTLKTYLETLSNNEPQQAWSRNERLAYWINLYNAATLSLILDNYPIASITEISGGKPWDQKFVVVGAKKYSLNQIENDIIRPKFNEPRIHFAVNCAAKSCPPLRNEAFVASKLEAQLEEQTTSFLSNNQYNKLMGTSLEVSKIFDWYGDDFGDIAKYIGKYANVVPGAKVRFNEYDWALNAQ